VSQDYVSFRVRSWSRPLRITRSRVSFFCPLNIRLDFKFIHQDVLDLIEHFLCRFLSYVVLSINSVVDPHSPCPLGLILNSTGSNIEIFRIRSNIIVPNQKLCHYNASNDVYLYLLSFAIRKIIFLCIGLPSYQYHDVC
jgi:hypothetical protein